MLALDHSHGAGEGFWEEYISILTDPAHFAAELTFTFLDILLLSPFLFFLWHLLQKAVAKALHREHRLIDQEHGHVHPEGEDHNGSSPF